VKAENLELKEFVDFSEGCVSLHGRRLVLHDMHSFAQFRRDLMETVGLEQARRMLTRFGYFWGKADAAAMKRIFTWDSMTEWLSAGPRMHTLQGVVRSSLKTLKLDESTGQVEMEMLWRDSGEAEEHTAELGTADMPVCWMLVGYASG
jgi:hypothetical protein